MNKWDPWVQTRNNPKHFSPSLYLHVPPLRQVSYHTQHRCMQISIDVSMPHREGPQEFFGARLPMLLKRWYGLGEFNSQR